MDYEQLLKKYHLLAAENSDLKTENEKLKTLLSIYKISMPCEYVVTESSSEPIAELPDSSSNKMTKTEEEVTAPMFNKHSNPKEKIELFMSLFRGRNDVWAKRWQNNKGKSGYTPVCLNEWKRSICNKPKIKCAKCSNKSYAALDESIIDKHLRNNDELIVGIYPMCLDETCYFLAIDFDEGSWQEDVSVLRESCKEFNIPVAVERSRSGNGAHVWFFFEKEITAASARKFGTALITYSMNKRHEIKFNSYDRFFPNQDTMPKGGLGNLIALPLEGNARKNKNSVFVDEKFAPLEDQWEFLGGVKKLSEETMLSLIINLSPGNELGQLKKDVEEEGPPRIKPWEVNQNKFDIKLKKSDFPSKVTIVKSNMIFILKECISTKALNVIKRLAAFKNPDFYKSQAMRMPTFDKPRIISCSEETTDYLSLPRGLEPDIMNLLNKFNIDSELIDKTNAGKAIDVEFIGRLREEQELAIQELIKHNNGVLSATTAFGKTVIGAKLIAELKVNTLVLVHRQQLLSQWKSRLSEFLKISSTEIPIDDKGPLPTKKKRGRKKIEDQESIKSLIGQLGAGKNCLSGIIDIAVMQSINSRGEIKDCVTNYGLIIVDECHHVPAFSFEQILKNVNAKYVYGLTATPIRKEGHHPIIFMQCGPIRYKVDAKKQAQTRPFKHFIIPRFTNFRVPVFEGDKELSIQEIYAEIAINELRNQFIIDDVIKSYQQQRNCLVLSERTAHVELLAKKLREQVSDVIILTGGMGNKETTKLLTQISELPIGKQVILVATGKYIGEGFDFPRLDTLFLAMPISWKGTLQQYAGRLHRLYDNKKEVQIYDYIDIQVRMLEKMYNKRLNGYASIGYQAKGENFIEDARHTGTAVDIIFDKNNFLPVYSNDIINAVREILIVSPFVSKKRVTQMLQYLNPATSKKVKITIITRPTLDFKEKDK